LPCNQTNKVMTILNKVESQVTEVVYTIQDEIGVIIYKEWINDSGKVIDSQMQDKDGYQIDDPAILEDIQNLVDSL